MSEPVNSSKTTFYKFGEFCLDARRKVLYRSGQTVALKPKIVETLIYLVENSGQVVSKDELLRNVWQETFVSDNSLSVNVYALRKIFREAAGGQDYIQTIPRRGFRFAEQVTKVTKPDAPFAEISEAETGIDEAPILIGNIQFSKQISKISQNPIDGRSLITPPRSFLISPRYALTFFLIGGLLLLASGAIYVSSRPVQIALPTTAAERTPQNLIAERGTSSPEARDFYLRGYRLWQTRSNDQMLRGTEFFRRALDIDPNFAAAYLGLADSYVMMNNNAAEWQIAESYVEKALTLEPDSAEAHASFGFILAFNKWQWQEAEWRFKHALELDPNSGKAHQWYAALLMVERRFAEAEAQLERAIEIYPESPNYHVDLAELYFFSRDDNYESVRRQCRRLYQITPESAKTGACSEFYIARIQKRYDEEFELSLKDLTRLGQSAEEIESSEFFRTYRRKGWRGKLEYEIAEYRKNPAAYNNDWQLISRYAALGDRDNVFRVMEKAYREHFFLLPYFNCYREFDELRDDSRYQAIMRQVGLTQRPAPPR